MTTHAACVTVLYHQLARRGNSLDPKRMRVSVQVRFNLATPEEHAGWAYPNFTLTLDPKPYTYAGVRTGAFQPGDARRARWMGLP